MYGYQTLITNFIMDFVTVFYLVKVSFKVHNKVCNESQLSIHDSSIKVSYKLHSKVGNQSLLSIHDSSIN